MAINNPIQNTVPDPLRKYASIALGSLGIITLAVGIACSVFPSLGGNADQALKYGALLISGGFGVIWDRQQTA